jgi:TRAP-type C4-dicarboxylate transport system permease small subunit
METPLWIPQLALPIGFCVLAVFLIEHLLLVLRSSDTGGK